MSPLTDIGQRLSAARRASRMTQHDLAQKLGVTQQQIARWEAASYRRASLERVSTVADALGVEPEAGGHPLPVAAETPAAYAAAARADASCALAGHPSAACPVRDLGEIAARLRAHSDVLRDRYHISRIGVFGSFAVGEQTPESDVDLLVESSDPGGLRWVEAAEYAEEVLGRRVDWSRQQLVKPRLRERISREVVYVWPA